MLVVCVRRFSFVFIFWILPEFLVYIFCICQRNPVFEYKYIYSKNIYYERLTVTQNSNS